MKNNILRKLMLIAVLLTGSHAFAYDFESNGIYYYILSEEDKTVEVTKGDNKYTGDVVIPAMVTYAENIYSVISIGYDAFYGNGINSIVIPETVTNIGDRAFYGCHLNIVDCKASIPPALGSNVFYNNPEACLKVPFELVITYKNNDSWSELSKYCGHNINNIYYLPTSDNEVAVSYKDSKYNSYTDEVVIPSEILVGNKTYNVTSIGENAFYDCNELYSVKMPNSIISIESGAFNSCDNLVSIDLSKSITFIGSSAFANCQSLPSIIISEGLIDLKSQAFYNCQALTTITLPNSLKIIEESVFSRCTSLSSINLPNSLESIGRGAFNSCFKLSSITIPNSVTNIAARAFYNCGLNTITIPNSVITIKEETFNSCNKLTSVIIGTSVTSIENNAFEDCNNLNSITIPNSITTFGNYAFSDCGKISSITIPNSVNKIGNYTFQGCSELKNITLGNQLSSVGVYAFKDCNNINKVESLNPTAPTMTETVFPTTVYENAQLVVPLGASESYQSATGWSKFTNTQAGYNVTVDYSSTGGVVSVNDSNETTVSVDFDTKVDFVITPKEGFEIEKVTLNEEDITENIVDGKYSLEKLTEDVIFAVTFRKLYTIATIFNSEEGIVTINGQEKNPIQVSFDTKVDFEITPNEGYEIDKVLLNEIDVTADVVEGKYSIERASEDVALNVTFRKLLIIGSTFNNEEGRVTINGAKVNPILVSTGSTLDFVITPNEGYEIDKVLLNEVDVTEHLQEGLLHIENVAGNIVLNVTFRKMMLIVTEFASEYGSVTINESEETSMFVSLGSKLDFTITPNEGYEIINVTLNDEDITADVVEGKYTIENATENVKLTVTFKLKTFALTLKCSEAGAFKRILNYGETATYEIVPSENWEINTVTFNGTDVTTELVDNVFTTPEITEDSELSVVFVDLATSVFSVYNTSDVKVYASQQTINIKGLEDNTPVAVYNPNGQMEYSKVATDYEMNINMNKDGVYLVKVGEKTFKVML